MKNVAHSKDVEIAMEKSLSMLLVSWDVTTALL